MSQDHPKLTPTKEQYALLVARHELTVLNGLHAFDTEKPDETFLIDASTTLSVIDEALGVNQFCDIDIDP